MAPALVHFRQVVQRVFLKRRRGILTDQKQSQRNLASKLSVELSSEAECVYASETQLRDLGTIQR